MGTDRSECALWEGSGLLDEDPKLLQRDSGNAAVIPRQLKRVSNGFDGGKYGKSAQRILSVEEAGVLDGEHRLDVLFVDFLDHQ